ncbi:MAG: DNA polymerase III subunit delta [Bdellovibrionales bacterium]
MKISPAQSESFLRKPDGSGRVALLFGPDTGLTRERADRIAKAIVPDINDPFLTASLSSSAVIDDAGVLYAEMAAQSLVGGRRLVRIQGAGDGVAAALGAWLKDKLGGDSFLLIEAGELDKRSKLKALCEGHAEVAVLASYVEEGPALQRTVSSLLQALGAKIEPEALTLLCSALPPDRLALRSEVEKLALYAGKDATITVEDVTACVHDAGAAEMDDLVFAVGAGQSKRVALLCDRLFDEQTSPVALLRTAQRHFLRLHWARAQMDQAGLGAADAVKKLQPPVFWKNADAMAAQLRRWSPARLDAALSRLYEAEAMVKRTGTPDKTLCARLLLSLAG